MSVALASLVTGKVHQARGEATGSNRWQSVCGKLRNPAEVVQVESTEPGRLCRHCWGQWPDRGPQLDAARRLRYVNRVRP